MELHDILDRALTSSAEVVRSVTPEQADLPTPCREWDVRTLTNHLLLVVDALALAGRGEPVPDEHWTGTGSGSFDVAAAWKDPGAWERTVRMGAMPMPAEMAVSMLLSDVVIHGWDLARATGQTFPADDEAAAVALRFLTTMGDQGRAMGIFDAAVPVAADAPAFDRALALSGRDPSH
ncbi:TIGR03086 family protein [Actinoplanes sp. LDG1-06]|uniref:TIGR03086 family protein n=1 Tax=Paractinoplanes ovalisporus TaxID=2810368 RepID=A0ABS2A4Z3_9ACTN|nr:TIGR03086 family metal-binding protein [Actinoplanes ovalisporus]MBM2614363.1 TIGR03086 family protein [Actinoplanes ovalisporus]